MIKKNSILLVISLIFLINTSVVLAVSKGAGDECTQGVDSCPTNYNCLKFDEKTYICDKATKGAGDICTKGVDTCVRDYDCLQADSKDYLCQKSTIIDIFGKIQPPDALKGLVNQDPTGAGGIGKFLSNLIALIYVLATIVLIIMLLWGAFDWMTSEGNKEKLEGARNKIINAIVGILLFAAAFGIIKVLGQFSGFKFFVGQ